MNALRDSRSQSRREEQQSEEREMTAATRRGMRESLSGGECVVGLRDGVYVGVGWRLVQSSGACATIEKDTTDESESKMVRMDRDGGRYNQVQSSTSMALPELVLAVANSFPGLTALEARAPMALPAFRVRRRACSLWRACFLALSRTSLLRAFGPPAYDLRAAAPILERRRGAGPLVRGARPAVLGTVSVGPDPEAAAAR